MSESSDFVSLVRSRLDWSGWEALIQEAGFVIDRPRGSAHPRYPDIIYPIEYGYVRGTLGTEGEELDLFVGEDEVGLVAAILTTDYRRGDREVKLLYNCSPVEIYLVNGFINYDRRLMEGALVMRYPMPTVRQMSRGETRRETATRSTEHPAHERRKREG